jgi:drug/metabolite transporter (DMT)-like permease
MKPAVWAAAGAAVLLWSAGPVATKIAVQDVDYLAVALLRTVMAGAVVLPIVLALGLPLPQGRGRWLLALSGLSGFVLFPLVFCLGMTATSSIHGVMILAFLPVLTGLFAHLWEGRRPALRWWAGCFIAFLGEVVLIAGADAGRGASAWGDGLVSLSTLGLALGYVAGGRLTESGYPAKAVTFWGLTLASLVMLPLLPLVLAEVRYAAVPPPAWAGIIYLALGVSVVGYIFWYWALAQGDMARVALVQFLQPVLGVLLGFLLLKEPLSASLGLALLLVLAGIALASRRVAGLAAPRRIPQAPAVHDHDRRSARHDAGHAERGERVGHVAEDQQP